MQGEEVHVTVELPAVEGQIQIAKLLGEWDAALRLGPADLFRGNPR
jgi:hypothetical protein